MLFKKMLPITAAGLLAMSLSACGDSESSAPSATDNSQVLPDSTTTPVDTTTTPQDTTPKTEPVVIPPTTGAGLLIDDLEDGDGGTLIGSGWYTYDDNDNDGASVITTPNVSDEGYPLPTAADNGTLYAFTVNYTLDKGEYAYDPYVGWGLIVPDSIDCSRFGGISYWYKGGKHEIHVETTDVMDYDVHLATVPASRTWKQVTIRFKDLAQGGWGEEVEFDASHIRAVSFQAKGNKVTDSVSIDNLYFQDTSEVVKDIADMQIRDPLIPEVTIGDIAIANPLQEKAMKYRPCSRAYSSSTNPTSSSWPKTGSSRCASPSTLTTTPPTATNSSPTPPEPWNSRSTTRTSSPCSTPSWNGPVVTACRS